MHGCWHAAEYVEKEYGTHFAIVDENIDATLNKAGIVVLQKSPLPAFTAARGACGLT